MAHSNGQPPIRWGNVKKIEVERAVIDNWFWEMKRIEGELERIRVTLGSLSREKDEEIKQLKKEVQNLKAKLKMPITKRK